MTRSRLPAWFWIVSLLIVAAAVGLAMVAVRGSTEDTGRQVDTLIAVGTAAASVVGGLWKLAQRTEDPLLPLRRAADELAKQLRWQWDQVAAEQGLTRPAPILVQWRWSPLPVTSPIAEAVSGIGGRRFEPLPGMVAVTAEQLRSGTLTDLLGVYGGLGSGRLIVLGEPGAGKSSAGILLLREALAHRARVRKRDRARVPVPVLVSPQGWNPTTEPFVHWLAGSLARDYPLLQASEYGEDAAMRLIEDGWLAVILDGLDEIPEKLYPEALRELNKQTFRLVVLTHTQELVAVVGGGHLQGAAALELLPIGPRQAAQYLASCLVDPPPARWQHVIDHLREQEHPESALAHALTTPLTLTLVRDTYGAGEAVDELLDVSRFPTRGAVENRLLDRVLTAAYTRLGDRLSPPFAVDQARQWLGQLAHRMNEDRTRDLAWWRIPHWVPAWPRAFITVTVVGLVSVLVWFLARLAAHMDLLPAFQIDPSTELAVLLARGLGYAFLFGFGLLFLFPPDRGSPARWEQPWWRRTEILMILFGAGVGVGSGLQNSLLSGGPRIGTLMGLVSSFVVGLGFVLGGRPSQQLGWLRESRTAAHTNPRTGLVVGLVAGLVAGLGYGLAYGIKSGLEYGFMVGLGYLLVVVVGGRTSPRQDQLRWSRTSTFATLLIGLIIAIVTTGGYGIIYVVIVLLGGRPAQQRSQLQWSRTTTPLALVGLGVGPLYWLWGWLVAGGTPHYRLNLSDLTFNLAFGLGFGLTAGLLVGSRPPMKAIKPLDPQSLWRRERRGGLVVGLVIGLVVGPVYGLGDGLRYGSMVGLMGGLVGGLVAGLGSGLMSSATWTTVLANVELRWRDKTPVHLLRFLDDAHKCQILRTVGSVYQFQNSQLQNRLAKTYEIRSKEAPDTPAIAA